MVIVCGTDFSHGGREATRCAAALAVARAEELVVLHVVDLPQLYPGWFAPEAGVPLEATQLLASLEARAEEELARLSGELGVGGARVRVEVRRGLVDRTLVELAVEEEAACIVVGATGHRAHGLWSLGSHADRIAQTASHPVLVVRSAAAFTPQAAKGGLRVLVALDRTPASLAALRSARALLGERGVHWIGAHVYWPPATESQPAKALLAEPTPGPLPLGSENQPIDRRLELDFRNWLARHGVADAIELRFVGGLGAAAHHLVELAEREGVDLLVVGSHQKSGWQRFWHGSISRGVIDHCSTNVLCVPTSTRASGVEA